MLNESEIRNGDLGVAGIRGVHSIRSGRVDRKRSSGVVAFTGSDIFFIGVLVQRTYGEVFMDGNQMRPVKSLFVLVSTGVITTVVSSLRSQRKVN